MEKEQNSKSAKFWDDVKGGLEKGYAASKVGLKKAGAALQKFSDKSVVAVEKKQLEAKRKKTCVQIGEIVAKRLSAKNASPIGSSDEEIAPLLKEVANFDKEIAKREKSLKELEKEGKTSDKQKADAPKKAGKKTSAKKADV
ncbi:MAG: hypothetical protein K2N58_06755 [Treponemataceae bacterium]|nr:hypothetical protein [Treponemataceae bacterium]